jgi:hypothetical protein
MQGQQKVWSSSNILLLRRKFSCSSQDLYSLFQRDGPMHRVHISLEMKQGYCVCPLSWSVHCNFTGDGKCNERGWACTPPPSPARVNFTLMTECSPESSGYYSVHSVVPCIAGGIERTTRKLVTHERSPNYQYSALCMF